MNKFFLTAGLVAVSASTLTTWQPVTALAAPAKAAAKAPSAKATSKPLPRYVSLETLKRLHKQNDPRRIPAALQPLIDGKSLKGEDRRDLITDPPLVLVNAKTKDMEVTIEADAAVSEGSGDPTVTQASMDGVRVAQGIPRPIAPAVPRRTPRAVTPRWVRYPLEFQLLGIGLGTKAVDKDRYNRIDRYGLFAIHGNPTAVVVPTAGGGAVQVNQQPPEVARYFPNSGGDYLPDWAAAITVQLDNNHVEWLYRRDTYSMGFVVDRLGFVDAIVVAGVYSPIARTQLEDPVHTIKLGDDLRKVLFRYGYPDTIETYPVNYAAGIAVGAAGGQAEGQAGAEGAAGAAGGQPPVGQVGGAQAGAAAAAGGGGAANSATRTFEVRYEQSYNVVFTVRNNRVVRIYIFGDPDFFNEQRRNAIRTQY